jgi:two-component system catabolic regulation response regulator CreB
VSAPSAEVLLVEDEPAHAALIAASLQPLAHRIVHVGTGAAAISSLAECRFDLVVLDVGLPDMSGFDVCRELRRFSAVPVVFLSARGEEIDRIVGLELGGDDYVVKPFSPREVVTRIRAILRRGALPAAASGPQATDFAINDAEQRITYRGHPLALTRVEYALLGCLLARPRRVFTREQLLEATGVPAGAGYERNVDSHVKSLRAKLREIAPEAEPIRTHRGVGYSYAPEQA